MSAVPPSDSPVRRRTPFRTGFDGPPPQQVAAGSAIRYAPITEKPGDDRDILFGYQIFLGRDPENSFVIADGKSNKLRGFISGLITSAECHGAVFTPLLAGRRLPHENVSPGPTPGQVDWLLHLFDYPADFAQSLRDAATWRDLWRALAPIPDFPAAQAASIATAPTAPAITPGAAADGFVLINVDNPKPAETLHPGAILTGSGWIIAPSDIVTVSIYLDGLLLCHARHGLPRPDVARNFPHYRHVDSCGFAFTTSLPQDLAPSAASLLRIGVTGQGGHTGEKTVAVSVTGKVAPGAGDAFPIRLAIEAADIDSSGELRLRGYAMARAPIASLVVYIGDTPLGVTETGLSRPEIETLHPDYPGAGTSGFVFAVTLAGVPEGPVSIRVQATDAEGRQRQAIMPAIMPRVTPGARRKRGDPAAAPSAARMRLEVDKPVLAGEAAQTPVRGALTISGWVVAPEGVESVTVFCDDATLGRAYLGMRREDIGRAFPGHEGALLAGFAMVLPPGSVAAGTRAIRLSARSRAGAVLDRAFTVQVDALDAPLAGGTIRTAMPRAEIAFSEALLAQRRCRPDFLLLIRADSQEGLDATLASLDNQAYPDWSAVVVLPSAKAVAQARDLATGRFASSAARLAFHTARTLPKLAGGQKVISVIHAGDVFGRDGLLELALGKALNPAADFIYADEYRPDPAQSRAQAFFKPAWSPELLLGMNYVGRPWCADMSLLTAAGLSLGGLATGGDYDSVLRLTEAAACIVHVDRLLLKRGAEPPETALAEAKALSACAARRGMAAEIIPTGPGTWHMRRLVTAPGRVSVIMPTCGGAGAAGWCAPPSRPSAPPTPGHDVQIVVVDNVPARNRALKNLAARPGRYGGGHAGWLQLVAVQ